MLPSALAAALTAFSLCGAITSARAENADEYLATLQIATAPGLSLTASDELIGRYGLSAREILLTLAPHLEGATLELASMPTGADGSTVHEDYRLKFGAHEIADAYLRLAHHRNQLVMLRAKLPAFRLPAEAFAASDFVPLAALGFEANGVVKAVIAESSGLAAPAWLQTKRAHGFERASETLVDAQTGAILAEREVAFDLQDGALAIKAMVYARGPNDGALVEVSLPELPPTGWLDGPHFRVYAPDESDPRVQARDLRFNLRPDDPVDSVQFDQVQAYYGAMKALDFFRARFGYDPGTMSLAVRVNLGGSQADNAAYTPPPIGPEILIGRGEDLYRNLAREVDVLVHEFAHHVIYRFLTRANGESGIVHEGTADFFAYAQAGDPFLGESVVPGGRFLRTAALAASDRYDTLESWRDGHFRGQYWSAVLWELRQRIGAEAWDRTVYEALPYLGPASGLRDAFLALFNADRDLAPLPEGNPERASYGLHKCMILEAGIARGFAVALEGIDGSGCGFNLKQLAKDSRALTDKANGKREGKRDGVKVSLFGKSCSTVGLAELRGRMPEILQDDDVADPRHGAPFLLWLLAMPVLAGVVSSAVSGRGRGDGP